jgi:hypothetical protein
MRLLWALCKKVGHPMLEKFNKVGCVLLVSAFFSLAGCGATLQKKMQSWVGSDESQLLSAWGAPDTSLETEDGKRIHTWKTMWNYNGSMYTCRQSFTINAERKVEKWAYVGC